MHLKNNLAGFAAVAVFMLAKVSAAMPEDPSVNVFLKDGADQNWTEESAPTRMRATDSPEADDVRSIHQMQQELFGQLPYTTEAQFDSLRGPALAAPRLRSKTAQGPLRKKVVGWHPYWMGTAYQRYDYSKLSTIAYFSYEVNPTNGSYYSLRGWDTTPLISWAHSNGVKVVLTATLFGSADNAKLLTNAASCQNLINTLATVVSNRNGDGVNIDFESVGSASKAHLTAFMSNLAVRFHRDLPGSEVSIALPAVDWGGAYDVGAYDGFLDYAIIMGYDYHWKTSADAGPVAPLYGSAKWGSRLSVHCSVTNYLGKGLRAGKLLLANPYYGYEWPAASATPGAATTGSGTAVLYPSAKNNAATYGRLWNADGSAPYYVYTNASAVIRQCWYDDAQSLGLKYDLVNAYDIAGVGIWALGYDDPLTELWDLIGEKFAPAVETDWDRRQSGTTASFYGVGAKGGGFAAVGAGGMIRTSADGLTWAAEASGVSELLLNVDGSGGNWVAVGDLGRILTSPDGATWTARATPTNAMLRAIAFGNGVHVAGGANGVILRSTNGGTNWALQSSGTAETIQGMHFGGGQFIAVGTSGAILTSPDGTTWTARSSGTSAWLLDAAYGNGTYVAVGLAGTVLSSTNGWNWTVRASGTTEPLYRVGFGNGQFVAAGTSGTIAGSPNGTTWAGETSGTTNMLRGVAFANGQFVVAGFSGTILGKGIADAAVAIATQNATVPNGTSSLSVSGTANAHAIGSILWTNSLGGSGTFAAAANWTFVVPLAVGENQVTVVASNAAGRTASATVQIVRSAPAAAPGAPIAATQPAGALSDIIVYCSAGHGFTGDGSWITGRGLTHGMVEDMGNVDQLNTFAEYCFQAGATVVPFRPVGYQANEVVLDNVSPGVTFGGAWSDSTSTIYYGAAGATPYRFSYVNSTGTTAWAIYRPTIPAEGFYPVYAWTRSGSDRVKQLYRIYHSGGVTDVRVNHRRVGLGWVWLGTYHFNAGTGGSVNISNHAPGENPASNVVIADAIRFGNGMGDVNRGVGISMFERELEASRYWIQNMVGQGMSSGLYDLSGYNDNSDNVGAPARMAAEMNREADGGYWDRIYLGFHSNADGGAGTARGPMGLYDNRGTTLKQNRQKDYGLVLAREINQDMEALDSDILLADDWANNSADMYGSAYGELYGTMNDEMNSTIIEVAFHNNAEDAKFLKDPVARRLMSMSSYQGIVKHLATNNAAVPLALLPEPPTAVRAINSGAGRVTVSWAAPASGGAFGDAATGYVVYRSTNGYGFGNPVAVAGGGTTSVTFTNLAAGDTWFFHVAATNRGGESLRSKVVGARVSPSGSAAHLVVDGFDRNHRTQTPNRYFANNVNGQVAMVRPRQINSFDYAVQHGKALAAAGVYFDTSGADAVAGGQTPLQNYHAAYWILGEESTANETFSAAEQSLVSAFLNAGRNLFVSGSELAYDLDAMGSAADKAFLTNVLRTAYAADGAGVYQAIAKNGGIFAGLGTMAFDNGSGPTYNVNSADVLAARGSPASVPALVYGTAESGTSIAALQYSNAWRAVIMGFPFETILSENSRNALMARVVGFFGTAAQDAPVVRITTASAQLPAGTTTVQIQGTNNAAVAGNLVWSNRLVGANGTIAANSPWSLTVPVLAGTNMISVSGRNFLGTQASTSTVQMVVAQSTTGAPPSSAFAADFESGTLAGWAADSAGAWAASAAGPLSGSYSLKHVAAGANTNYASIAQSYSVEGMQTTWRFLVRYANANPSGGNRFHVYLMANQANLTNSAVSGYAVGVNLSGTDDRLKLWRVANGSAAATVADSTLTWRSTNMVVAVEVVRTPGGTWTLSYSTNGQFGAMESSAPAVDAVLTNTSHFGAVFVCSSSFAGKFWLDDVRIDQLPCPDVTILNPSAAVPNATTQWTLTGRCANAAGNLAWTNSAGGGGLFAAASNWTLAVTGLKTGENAIRVVATGVTGLRATGAATIVRSPYACGNARHDPAASVPGGGTMRTPATASPSKPVAIYSASQNGGIGNVANQTGGRLRYRRAGTATWQSIALSQVGSSGSEVFWSATIPGGTFQSLNTVEYYLEINYSDREPTYVSLDALGQPSLAGISQTIAQSRPFAFSYSQEGSYVLDDDFEVPGLAGWHFNEAHSWTNSADAPISGSRSARHNRAGVAATNTMYALPNYSVNSARTSWRFTVANGNFDPAGGNRFEVFLMADGTNLEGSASGYAVGINMGGISSDMLRLCRIDGGTAASTMVLSALDWNANTTASVEVVRHPEGLWELFYATNGAFQNMVRAGSGSDSVHLDTSVFGMVYRCTSTRAGLLRWDDVRISQEVFSSISVDEPIYRVANETTQCAIGGAAAHVAGNVAWTNTLGGGGSFAATTPEWAATISGLKVGENRIVLTATNASGGKVSAETIVARSAWSIGNAFHAPSMQLPGVDLMRSPADPVAAQPTYLYAASQATGAGNAATQTGGRLFHRRQGTTAWSAAEMVFDSAVGTNAIWRAALPSGTYAAGQTVQYYFELDYADRGTTYVSAAGPGSSASAAQSQPFAYAYSASASAAFFRDDFESGALDRWSSSAAGVWENSASNPIAGARYLRHAVSRAAATNAIAAAVPLNGAADRTAWRFVLRNGNFDPSGNNKFFAYLMADRGDLLGTANGYAVGVNMTGTDDKLKIWRVENGAVAATVATSTLLWDPNMTVAVEVVREADGSWALRYGADGTFNALSAAANGTDATFASGTHFGLVFQCTMSYAGMLGMDDVSIARNAAAGASARIGEAVGEEEAFAEGPVVGLSGMPDDPAVRWLAWRSEEGKAYAIEQSTDLRNGFRRLVGGIAATPPENTYPVPATTGTLYLRVVEQAPQR